MLGVLTKAFRVKLDLHCHTYFSDGAESPQSVINRAIDNGVTHLAITDHDCQPDLAAISRLDEIELIHGVEISCQWGKLEIHVVGLKVDHSSTTLSALLSKQQLARTERIQLISEKLEKHGCFGLLDYLEKLPCIAYTRSHVANFLVAQGVCKTRQKAFKQYLGKGAKAYVPGNWCDLAEAIDAIHAAGGISVLAHPGRYPLNKRGLTELVAEFSSTGGDAIEVRYPNIDVNMMRRLEAMGREINLLYSVGSDFHDPAAHWTDIGKFPPLRGDALEYCVTTHSSW